MASGGWGLALLSKPHYFTGKPPKYQSRLEENELC
jgi:hypothetical protein